MLPAHYSGGGLTIKLFWAASTATANGVVWGTSIERQDEATLDLDADSFAAESTIAATAPGTSGALDYAQTAHTSGAQMDSLAAGERFRLKVARKVADGSDTMTGDAELYSVSVLET